MSWLTPSRAATVRPAAARDQAQRRVEQLVHIGLDERAGDEGGNDPGGVDGLAVVAHAGRPLGQVGGGLRDAEF
ncbi:MAG TPA: hypothetical protein VF062_07340 [Candidatus Limnocylindrales bacterium]